MLNKRPDKLQFTKWYTTFVIKDNEKYSSSLILREANQYYKNYLWKNGVWGDNIEVITNKQRLSA